MKRIITSLALLVMVASLTIAGTRAWFSSQAQVNDITFSTGVLEVRVNGASAIAGVSMTNAAPGSRKSGSFTINNYGNPYFAGPSTLDAKEIAIKVADLTGDQELNNALMVDLFANAGWSGCSNSGVEFIPGKGCRIYTGLVKDMTEKDVLEYTQWGSHASLSPGSSITINYDVYLPDTGGDQNELQGKSSNFDFVITAYNPHRT